MPWQERLGLLRGVRSWQLGLSVAAGCLAAHLGLHGSGPEASWRCLGAGASAGALKPQAGPWQPMLTVCLCHQIAA